MPATATPPPPGDAPPATHPMPGGASAHEAASKRTKTGLVVVNTATIDIDAYAAGYVGSTRIDRLLFIADRCPPLALDALRLAIRDITSSTLMQSRYLTAHARLNAVLASQGKAQEPVDQNWVDNTTRVAKSTLDRLENELKQYRANMIKESIRMGYNDLAQHYINCGDLANAFKVYMRTRDYCTSQRHQIDMCMNVIKVAILMNNYVHVASYVYKAEHMPDLAKPSSAVQQQQALPQQQQQQQQQQQPQQFQHHHQLVSSGLLDSITAQIIKSRLAIARALFELDSGRYRKTARCLLDVDGPVFVREGGWPEILSASDAAICLVLCALATFDRAEIRSRVRDSAHARALLELEPWARDIVHAFDECRYTALLDLLERHRGDVLLDVHLHNHVDSLYALIRRRALAQYAAPYVAVSLECMAAAFNTPVAALETELAELIASGDVDARIDAYNKILYSNQTDERARLVDQTTSLASTVHREVRHVLHRMQLIQRGLIVNKHQQGQQLQSQNQQQAQTAVPGEVPQVPASGVNGKALSVPSKT